MNFVALWFTFASDGESRVTAQSQYGGENDQNADSSSAQQVLARAVVNQTKLLGVEVEETEYHSETNAEREIWWGVKATSKDGTSIIAHLSRATTGNRYATRTCIDPATNGTTIRESRHRL